MSEKCNLRLGIDVGSTTVKLVILDKDTKKVLYNHYERHHAEQVLTAKRLLKEASKQFPDTKFRIVTCGSGGAPVASRIKCRYIQEVVANSAAVRLLYPKTRTAIELGGQDAKIIFFYNDNGRLVTSDMRMNGSCAGGTGAFIDEIASLLKVPSEQFESLAAKGSTVHSISGRCGVFAKTDIQSLLNSGGKREDIALSAYHAIVKQTIGGLAQGLELKPPIIFEGGPLTYDHTLVKAFANKLNLKDEDIIRPDHPETIVARGAAIAVDELFPQVDENEEMTLEEAFLRLELSSSVSKVIHTDVKPYFSSKEECEKWRKEHTLPDVEKTQAKAGDTLNIYIGIDAGSTTSKLVFMDENEEVIDRFYANNQGNPIEVVKHGLMDLYAKYESMGITLNVLGLGTTGYGELLLGKAFGADYHTVETVSHAAAARKAVPDVSFILDIGGQDMKGIWIKDGIVTNITLNEACSSGCGSFLQNFASSLNIPTEKIADAAFNSEHPADLGSRCTVFMNSTIINEQKNGCGPDDIMAGLCRSIIKNVFTKVVRISSPAVLGNKIVVQGGTFKNDAVLRALEQYLDCSVTRAPYPGEMGAIGVALLTKETMEKALKAKKKGLNPLENTEGLMEKSCTLAKKPAAWAEEAALVPESAFIGFENIEDLTYTQTENVICLKCANRCNRSLVTFSNGTTFITGNRCPRGEILLSEETKDINNYKAAESIIENEKVSGITPVKSASKLPSGKTKIVPDLFLLREQLLFKKYDCEKVCEQKNITIGLPRTLEYWDSMPFWSTFFTSLGYKVVMSDKSSRPMFEEGIPFVPSDTVCFPAKLSHGHIRNLVDKLNKDTNKEKRIFMPMVMEMPPTDKAKASNYVCAVVKGYPLIVSHSENPEKRWGVPFDHPMFHWYSESDRLNQIIKYFTNNYGLTETEVRKAFKIAEKVLLDFRQKLKDEGQKIINQVTQEGSFAVVLAGRPYHTDALVSHDLSRVFTKQNIPVLTVDSLPELNDVNLRYTRAEVTNNFHTRMLAGAMLASKHPNLEYVQIVSFGCGHDAILSDEIIRVMDETSGKVPLILKMDEGGAANSLGIRVKSFIETVFERRLKKGILPFKELGDAYKAKLTKKGREYKTVLIPNTSVAFCKILSGILCKNGLKAVPLPLGEIEQIQCGKKYVHNDTCFPAQMVIGEAISMLQSGKYPLDKVCIGMAKYQGDCRLTHYSALLRRGLDAAGFDMVPIVSTDPADTKEMHPGFKLGAMFNMQALWAVTMMDILEELRRKIRPYEIVKGETNKVFDKAIDSIAEAFKNGIGQGIKAYKKGIDELCKVKYNRENPRPRVFVTGEYLVTFHPGSNFHVEDYLEANGMEVILPRMINVFRKDFFARIDEAKNYGVKFPKTNAAFDHVAEFLFKYSLNVLEKYALKHPLYTPSMPMEQLALQTDDIMNRTFLSGEGWLIPGEIKEHAQNGVKSFVILQPFGCLPNHICGRGIMKKLKEEFPSVQLLPLDLDPDTSFANVENRLQMLIMNEKSRKC